jgi:signal recognition particle subunit SRP54
VFESLQERLTGVFDKLRRRGSLSESDVDAALREVRVALLEADVALPVVKDFIDQVRSKAVGQQVLRSVTPGQQVVKIVHDHLVEFLGKDPQDLSLRAAAPVPILMVGLQGSGKTTSTGKIALRLKDREKKKVLMASVDIHRPAAQEQLAQIGRQIGVATLPVVFGELPVAIARRAMETGRREGYDVVFVDTAGRLGIDEKMMQEAIAVRDAINPHETLLVADAMTGQDAVNVAKAFNERIGVTGIMLTRVDGDARGGAALSMRAVTGKPLKFLGVGEKMDAIEAFHPDRIAGRILGMGDVVSLVERAAETIEQEDAEKLARKMQKGQMDLEDMLSQLRQVKKMGGLGGIMKMLPGVGKMQKQLAGANIDEKMIGRQEAIILSMTKKERARPDLIKASRKQRIAAGSGSTVQEVNRLLKQFQQMQSVMKKVGKMDKTSLMRSGLGGLMGGGGMGGMGGPGGQGGPFGPRGMR